MHTGRHNDETARAAGKGAAVSRRCCRAFRLGALLPGALLPGALLLGALLLGALRLTPPVLAAGPDPPIRLAISESLVSGVNLNDARAAMRSWLKQMMTDYNLAIEFSPTVFDTSEEILRRGRAGQLDAVALNIVEFRQIADWLDPTQIVAMGGEGGPEQYLLLAKKSSGLTRLGSLRGRRLTILENARMCIAQAWLSTLLAEEHLGTADQFFGSIAGDSKPARVVLPVFFGQADVCLTSKRAFDTMCELNPQVARELTAIAVSPPLVVTFYTFHRNYHGVSRDRLVQVYANLPASAAGRQLAMLFQFEKLAVSGAACLAPALAILETADRIRRGRDAGGRK